jgi:hypothetical protein
MPGREAKGARVSAEIPDPQRPRVLNDQTQHAAPTGPRTNRALLIV